MGSRIGSFYLPYAFAAFIWIPVVPEIPWSFGHEDPLNRRLVSGTLLTIFASSLRLSSFRSLGHYFTYQLAILPLHTTLVTTGPYAYIQHPSYVAPPFAVFGWALVPPQGTVSREWFGESNTDGVVLSAMVGMLDVSWQLAKRVEVEDRVLKEEFGKE